MSALPHFSDIDLLRYCKRIIDLNSEITDCTLDFGVAEQKLNYSKISEGSRGSASTQDDRCQLLTVFP